MVREICIIEDFILPKLKNKWFGHLMEWEDEFEGIFRVFWSHKSGRKWQKKYFLVFTEWDKMKGRENHGGPGYYTEAKGRFRSALTRLKNKIEALPRERHYRRYKLKMNQISEVKTEKYLNNFYSKNICNLQKKEEKCYKTQLSDEQIFDLEGIEEELYIPQIKNEELFKYDRQNDQIYNSNLHIYNEKCDSLNSITCSPSSISTFNSENHSLDHIYLLNNYSSQKDNQIIFQNFENISEDTKVNYVDMNWNFTNKSEYENFIPKIKKEQNSENFLESKNNVMNDSLHLCSNEDNFIDLNYYLNEHFETLSSSLTMDSI